MSLQATAYGFKAASLPGGRQALNSMINEVADKKSGDDGLRPAKGGDRGAGPKGGSEAYPAAGRTEVDDGIEAESPKTTNNLEPFELLNLLNFGTLPTGRQAFNSPNPG